jgi:hypothetical protein
MIGPKFSSTQIVHRIMPERQSKEGYKTSFGLLRI